MQVPKNVSNVYYDLLQGVHLGTWFLCALKIGPVWRLIQSSLLSMVQLDDQLVVLAGMSRLICLDKSLTSAVQVVF